MDFQFGCVLAIKFCSSFLVLILKLIILSDPEKRHESIVLEIYTPLILLQKIVYLHQPKS